MTPRVTGARCSSPAEFAAVTCEETQKWGWIVKGSGAKID